MGMIILKNSNLSVSQNLHLLMSIMKIIGDYYKNLTVSIKHFFYIFFSFQFFNNYERLYFTAHVIEECVCVCVCDYMLMYALYVSVLAYCPSYCDGYLMRSR